VLSLALRDPQAASNTTAPGAAPPEILLRLRHIFEAGAHPTLSQPAAVNLGTLFSRGPPLGLLEKSLTLAYDWDGLERRAWPTTAGVGAGGVGGSNLPSRGPAGSNSTVVLGPMEIKTFTFTWPVSAV
jgi:hypothetical protein